jgi:hypothetical protein
VFTQIAWFYSHNCTEIRVLIEQSHAIPVLQAKSGIKHLCILVVTSNIKKFYDWPLMQQAIRESVLDQKQINNTMLINFC